MFSAPRCHSESTTDIPAAQQCHGYSGRKVEATVYLATVVLINVIQCLSRVWVHRYNLFPPSIHHIHAGMACLVVVLSMGL